MIISPQEEVVQYIIPPLKRSTYNIHKLASLIKAVPSPVMAVIEAVGPRRRDGKKQLCSFCGAYGMYKGILAAYNIPFFAVSPLTWKGVLKLYKKGKEGSIALSKELFGEEWYDEKYSYHDGIHEAALIAYFGKQYLEGNYSQLKFKPIIYK